MLGQYLQSSFLPVHVFVLEGLFMYVPTENSACVRVSSSLRGAYDRLLNHTHVISSTRVQTDA